MLVYDDDTTIEASGTGYDDFPKPGYPFGERTVAPGRCVRGWITFAVPGNKRPAFIEYGPDSQRIPIRWAVR